MGKLTKEKPVIFHFRRVISKQSDHTCLSMSAKHIEESLEIRELTKDSPILSARGGMTVIFDPRAKMFGIGKCSALDNFCKAKGRELAERNMRTQRSRVGEYTGLMTLEYVRSAAYQIAQRSLPRTWSEKSVRQYRLDKHRAIQSAILMLRSMMSKSMS